MHLFSEGKELRAKDQVLRDTYIKVAGKGEGVKERKSRTVTAQFLNT